MKKILKKLKGFRDFLPVEKRKRDFIKRKLEETFKLFNFQPLETPTLEYASLLLGKYGQEADKLVYSFEDRGGRKVALPYDQTVPTARVLIEYRDKLPKYFRRYQIQDVFRADKPQKGRYRQFTQCDIDIFGTISPLADAEILATTYFALRNIGFTAILLEINDRRLLFKTLEKYGTKRVSIFSIIQSVDKLEKKGRLGVKNELVAKGLAETVAENILKNIETIKISSYLKKLIKETSYLGVPKKVFQFSPSLARGLDYYTEMIFEVKTTNYPLGSLGGGGRYDNLIGQLSGIDIPAVGVGLGFDRIVEAASQLKLIPIKDDDVTVMVTIFNETMMANSLKIAYQLRNKGVKTEIYPVFDKLSKQLKYASQAGFTYVIIFGPEEKNNNLISVKNLITRQQEKMTVFQFILSLKKS